MLIGNPARPIAREVMFERLRFADTLVATSRHVREQQVDPLQHFSILHLPPQVVLPRVLVPDEKHLSRSRSIRGARHDRTPGAPWRRAGGGHWSAIASGMRFLAATRSPRGRR